MRNLQVPPRAPNKKERLLLLFFCFVCRCCRESAYHGDPGETQRSGFVGERSRNKMNKFSCSAGKRMIWRLRRRSPVSRTIKKSSQSRRLFSLLCWAGVDNTKPRRNPKWVSSGKSSRKADPAWLCSDPIRTASPKIEGFFHIRRPVNNRSIPYRLYKKRDSLKIHTHSKPLMLFLH